MPHRSQFILLYNAYSQGITICVRLPNLIICTGKWGGDTLCWRNVVSMLDKVGESLSQNVFAKKRAEAW